MAVVNFNVNCYTDVKHNITCISCENIKGFGENCILCACDDGCCRVYSFTDSSLELKASLETGEGPGMSLISGDLTGSGNGVIMGGHRGSVFIFTESHLLSQLSVSSHAVHNLQLLKDSVGNCVIVLATFNVVCAMNLYGILWSYNICEWSSGSHHEGHLCVTSLLTVDLPSANIDVDASYVLVADTSSSLHVLSNGRRVLCLQLPEVVTAMCCGCFDSTRCRKVALATTSGAVYLMADFQIEPQPCLITNGAINRCFVLPSATGPDVLCTSGTSGFALSQCEKILYRWKSSSALVSIDLIPCKSGVSKIVTAESNGRLSVLVSPV